MVDDARGVSHDIIGKVIRSKNQLAMVECEDANGNTPLSEASSEYILCTSNDDIG